MKSLLEFEFNNDLSHPVDMTRTSALKGLLLWAMLITPQAALADAFSEDRRMMIEDIEDDIRMTAQMTGRDAFDERVMAVMGEIPRHEFVPEERRQAAYDNRPLPIGFGQTISQPYIVALMTDLLNPQPTHRVLEIGTGSGYQAAVLSRLVDRVYSIEIIEELGTRTRDLLQRLGYDNVEVRVADGYTGWPEQAPFDGIIVTAAISHIPPPLVRQLAPGGRMIIPVGTRFQTQQLTVVEKDAEGKISSRQLLPVAFVPFTGGH